MKKKLGSLFLALVMIICLGQAAMGTAFAGQYDYIVTFHSQGGHVGSSSGPADLTKSLSQSAYAIAAECKRTPAYRDTYKHLGWFTASSGGTYISPSYVGTPVNVYAHWLKVINASKSVSYQGTTFYVTFEGTGGHSWTFMGMSPSAVNWVHVSKVNSTKYQIIVDYRSDSTYASRGITLRFQDNYGFNETVTISQAANIEAVRNRVDNTLQPSGSGSGSGPIRFYNVCSGTNNATYNMRYAALFRCGGTWCTDSAMMDLLNRRLCASSLLATNRFFDLRDIVVGMAAGSGANSNFTGFSVAQADATHSDVVRGSYSNGGGEWCNYTSGTRDKNFTNNYGGQASKKTYKVRFEGYNSSNNATTMRNKIKTLLNSHPEGVFVYSNAGGNHALLIVGYDDNGFWYVDNGASAANTGRIRYSSTCFAGGGHGNKTEDQFLTAIRCIAYVTN